VTSVPKLCLFAG